MDNIHNLLKNIADYVITIAHSGDNQVQVPHRHRAGEQNPVGTESGA